MESKSNPSIAIIIPAYNEEKVISSCIDEVVKVIKQLKLVSRLIIINDGSRDLTQEILNEKEKKYPKFLTVITHKKNKGYGAATQTGINYAIKNGFDWGIHMDSDLTNDPKYIISFSKYATKKYDCIKASRYIKKSKVLNVPFYRRAISTVGNLIAHHLFNVGIRDCTNGFRMVRLTKLENINFQENNFSIILEELYYLKKAGSKFTEIPYVLTARTNSQSHFTYRPQIFRDYIKYAIKSFFI